MDLCGGGVELVGLCGGGGGVEEGVELDSVKLLLLLPSS
jgi:hypothetical protein